MHDFVKHKTTKPLLAVHNSNIISIQVVLDTKKRLVSVLTTFKG